MWTGIFSINASNQSHQWRQPTESLLPAVREAEGRTTGSCFKLGREIPQKERKGRREKSRWSRWTGEISEMILKTFHLEDQSVLKR